MAKIKMPISKVKLPFYPQCEVKCKLQNEVSTFVFCCLYWVFDYVPQQKLMSNDLLFQFSKILKKLITWIVSSLYWIFLFKVCTYIKIKTMLALMAECCS